jgi:hypothetical protein
MDQTNAIRRRVLRYTLVTFAAALGIGAFGLLMHVRRVLVDFNTGDQKVEIWIAGVRVYQNTTPSVLATACTTSFEQAQWRRVSESSLFLRNSPYFTDSATPSLLKEVELIGEQRQLSIEMKCLVWHRVLELLKHRDRAGAERLIDEWRLGGSQGADRKRDRTRGQVQLVTISLFRC